MNLTKEIIRALEERSAKIKPALRMDGSFPEDVAFLFPELGRGFDFEMTINFDVYSFTLFEKRKDLDYFYCHARGMVSGLSEMADLIIDWCDRNAAVEELNSKYSGLESFMPFIPKHKNERIEKAWVKVKNSTFNDSGFWKRIEWLNLNDMILSEARRMAEFENYYPFTSHDCLRFGIDENLTETWTLGLIIQPSIIAEKGRFQVSHEGIINEAPKYFDDVTEALRFLKRKMIEQQPIKWK